MQNGRCCILLVDVGVIYIVVSQCCMLLYTVEVWQRVSKMSGCEKNLYNKECASAIETQSK